MYDWDDLNTTSFSFLTNNIFFYCLQYVYQLWCNNLHPQSLCGYLQSPSADRSVRRPVLPLSLQHQYQDLWEVCLWRLQRKPEQLQHCWRLLPTMQSIKWVEKNAWTCACMASTVLLLFDGKSSYMFMYVHVHVHVHVHVGLHCVRMSNITNGYYWIALFIHLT